MAPHMAMVREWCGYLRWTVRVMRLTLDSAASLDGASTTAITTMMSTWSAIVSQLNTDYSCTRMCNYYVYIAMLL